MPKIIQFAKVCVRFCQKLNESHFLTKTLNWQCGEISANLVTLIGVLGVFIISFRYPFEYNWSYYFVHREYKPKYLHLPIITRVRIQFRYLLFLSFMTNQPRHINTTRKFFNGAIHASFCLFLLFSHHNSITNWKKRRCCAWDSNLGT